jgi:hypothetical protein
MRQKIIAVVIVDLILGFSSSTEVVSLKLFSQKSNIFTANAKSKEEFIRAISK